MRWPLVVVFACLIACGNKDREDRPPPATPVGLAPESAVVASCAKLLPQALVDKHLAGYAFDAGASSVLLAVPATLCVYRKAAPPEADAVLASISFAPGDATEKLDAMVKNGARDVRGIGRRAVRMGDNIEFWSTHTDCVVALPANEQFAKDLDATLTTSCAPTP
ncbi:MAG: hypothetical protein ABJE66_22730 [Deltaproteobacteria bacterium]